MISYWPEYCSVPLRPSVVTVGPPEAEVISLTAMKQFLRDPLSSTTNDDRIKSLIVAARVHCERHTHRSIVKKPYMMSLSRFPNRYWDRTEIINLWNPPLVSNVSITYIDTDGLEQDYISGRDFQVDYAGEPGRIAPLAGQCWPSTKFGALNAVRIYYTAGYEPNSDLRFEADAVEANIEEPEENTVDVIPADNQVEVITVDRTIPADLVNGIMQLVVHWYQNRTPVNAIPGAGGGYLVLPWHIEKIFDNYVFDTLTPTVTPEF